ncbi:uncharacterized protein L969DRAFT_91335 [Mixia osmundae IAM 14324]|uniref:Endonuclease/exonuclease/phosphatase domain-containing protein n=1 Tax=Mixia osmundae (strain CBS 9802 / IAM 14324 / JCM 22182 / KY 12970) TaxID=764103 RepID=G7E4K2_MIXOS|nr:uncharacterized protein L969DRAFT_91335 [Mixia osmundae IAM 14324]KEI41857.1 hypothetical protein L969DRAFT_91335 [Mixia osmundae IAM 14324]GAA97762.1 hypothetical protein E5Q_04441 [Mixia osmundae IAM 14324]
MRASVLVIAAASVILASAHSPVPARQMTMPNPFIRQTLDDLKLATFNIRYDPRTVSSVSPAAIKRTLLTAQLSVAEDAAEKARRAGKERPWSERLPKILEQVHWEQPDIIGFQETLHPQYVNLVAGLSAEHQGGYDSVGVGRDDGEQAGESVPIFWRRDKLELIDVQHHWLSPTPEKPGSKGWDAGQPRMMTLARLRPVSLIDDAIAGVLPALTTTEPLAADVSQQRQKHADPDLGEDLLQDHLQQFFPPRTNPTASPRDIYHDPELGPDLPGTRGADSQNLSSPDTADPDLGADILSGTRITTPNRNSSGDQQIWVVNTHYDDRGAQAREQSSHLILRIINDLLNTPQCSRCARWAEQCPSAHRQAGLPARYSTLAREQKPLVLLLGDLNSEAHEAGYRVLTGDRYKQRALTAIRELSDDNARAKAQRLLNEKLDTVPSLSFLDTSVALDSKGVRYGETSTFTDFGSSTSGYQVIDYVLMLDNAAQWSVTKHAVLSNMVERGPKSSDHQMSHPSERLEPSQAVGDTAAVSPRRARAKLARDAIGRLMTCDQNLQLIECPRYGTACGGALLLAISYSPEPPESPRAKLSYAQQRLYGRSRLDVQAALHAFLRSSGKGAVNNLTDGVSGTLHRHGVIHVRHQSSLASLLRLPFTSRHHSSWLKQIDEGVQTQDWDGLLDSLQGLLRLLLQDRPWKYGIQTGTTTSRHIEIQASAHRSVKWDGLTALLSFVAARLDRDVICPRRQEMLAAIVKLHALRALWTCVFETAEHHDLLRIKLYGLHSSNSVISVLRAQHASFEREFLAATGNERRQQHLKRLRLDTWLLALQKPSRERYQADTTTQDAIAAMAGPDLLPIACYEILLTQLSARPFPTSRASTSSDERGREIQAAEQFDALLTQVERHGFPLTLDIVAAKLRSSFRKAELTAAPVKQSAYTSWRNELLSHLGTSVDDACRRSRAFLSAHLEAVYTFEGYRAALDEARRLHNIGGILLDKTQVADLICWAPAEHFTSAESATEFCDTLLDDSIVGKIRDADFHWLHLCILERLTIRYGEDAYSATEMRARAILAEPLTYYDTIIRRGTYTPHRAVAMFLISYVQRALARHSPIDAKRIILGLYTAHKQPDECIVPLQPRDYMVIQRFAGDIRDAALSRELLRDMAAYDVPMTAEFSAAHLEGLMKNAADHMEAFSLYRAVHKALPRGERWSANVHARLFVAFLRSSPNGVRKLPDQMLVDAFVDDMITLYGHLPSAAAASLTIYYSDLAESGQGKLALQKLKLLHARIRIDVELSKDLPTLYVPLLQAYGRCGALSEAEEIWQAHRALPRHSASKANFMLSHYLDAISHHVSDNQDMLPWAQAKIYDVWLQSPLPPSEHNWQTLLEAMGRLGLFEEIEGVIFDQLGRGKAPPVSKKMITVYLRQMNNARFPHRDRIKARLDEEFPPWRQLE